MDKILDTKSHVETTVSRSMILVVPPHHSRLSPRRAKGHRLQVCVQGDGPPRDPLQRVPPALRQEERPHGVHPPPLGGGGETPGPPADPQHRRTQVCGLEKAVNTLSSRSQFYFVQLIYWRGCR